MTPSGKYYNKHYYVVPYRRRHQVEARIRVRRLDVVFGGAEDLREKRKASNSTAARSSNSKVELPTRKGKRKKEEKERLLFYIYTRESFSKEISPIKMW